MKSTFGVKEGQIDPTAFVVNYNEGGFIIVSGDNRMIPVLAFSDTGSFEMSEISKLPPGVSQWMEGNHRYISDLRTGKRKEVATVASGWKNLSDKSELTKGNFSVLSDFPPCEDEDDVNTFYTTYYSYGPLLSSTWGQYGVGYNDWMSTGCSINQNYREYVGCVGVSIAQIMYYHQYPTGFSWSSMSPNSGSSATAALMAAAANAVGTNFGCGSSSAPTNATDDAFKSTFGYSNAVVESFDINMAVSNITNGYPIILAANKSLLVGGHQWVADGFWFDQTYICAEVNNNENPPFESKNPPVATHSWQPIIGTPYFYMNWGWHGSYNAWYNSFVWSVAGSDYDYGMKQVRSIIP